MQFDESTHVANLFCFYLHLLDRCMTVKSRKCLYANFGLLVQQETLFSMELSCTWLEKALVGSSILIFSQMAHD
jgi:hypothetical protein